MPAGGAMRVPNRDPTEYPTDRLPPTVSYTRGKYYMSVVPPSKEEQLLSAPSWKAKWLLFTWIARREVGYMEFLFFWEILKTK